MIISLGLFVLLCVGLGLFAGDDESGCCCGCILMGLVLGGVITII